MAASPRPSTLLLLAALLLAGGARAAEPPEVEAALAKAGANRAELEKVLAHCAGDGQKLAAARFLIANMEGHGHAVLGFVTKEGREVAFDALAYKSYAEAQAAFDALEKEHGTLDYRRTAFHPDLETATAPFLVENIDLAFEAWRGHPWAKAIPFDVFCESILPYRGSEEPLVPWRRACRERLAEVHAALGGTEDPAAAGRAVVAAAGKWIGFDEIYYLHPTDQGYDEMARTRLGRCEDISNMMTYAARASATLSATDYTPAWADRDNNHAWEVVLDAEGRGLAPLAHRAAKVYRKTFAVQRASLGAIRREEEKVPRWLAGTHFRDVTAQYVATTDVTLALADRPEGHRFAYLAVFNGGEWVAIHWAPVGDDGSATFAAMGRGIAYLPAWHAGEELLPAGPPFLLGEDGAVTPLPGAGAATTLLAAATSPRKVSPDTHEVTPVSHLARGKSYELRRWEAGWRKVSEGVAGEEPLRFEGLPADALYWLVEKDSRELERIFTIEGGSQRFW